jgi:hypothetical protein
MEEYINNDTLIENEISKMLKPQLTCPLCNNILIDPLMCMVCQKAYCKKCIDNSINKDKKCSCENPNYQKYLSKIEMLSSLKFICVGCGKDITYNEAQKHHDSCCPGKTSKDMKINKTPKESRIKKLDSEEMSKLKKKGKKIEYITGNLILYFLFFI